MSKVRIYLGEVQTTRKIRKVVLTGREAYWNTEGNMFTLPVDMPLKGYADYICSHYNAVFSYDDCNRNNNTMAISKRPTLFIRDDTYSIVSDFKAFLAEQYAAGTPVCVWYVLATPKTAVVNEPLRKIGDYADTLSMEQAGVQIPTLHGNTVIDVDTTLKPSEMYIKYQG